jgi:hypothetical protein
MAFSVGHKKQGGRQKGTPNKASQSLMEKAEAMGIDPFMELLKLIRNGETEMTRMMALKEACQYLYPKRKAVEISSSEDVGFKVVIEDYKTRETK